MSETYNYMLPKIMYNTKLIVLSAMIAMVLMVYGMTYGGLAYVWLGLAFVLHPVMIAIEYLAWDPERYRN